jgi:hypothetical protein
MRTWKTASPYAFTGYYLHAPCYGDRGWMGHRAALMAMGWNIVPIYVGQQVAGVSPCKSSILAGAQGRADAQDCVKTLTAEGFAKGCFAYLDVERSDLFPSALRDYISAWTATLVAGGFGPGVYCHKHNAPDVRATVLTALASSTVASLGVKPRFWIVGGATADFDAPNSLPSGSGIAFADMWQRPAAIDRSFGGVKINIDEDIATLRDPAKPDPPPVPPLPPTPPAPPS